MKSILWLLLAIAAAAPRPARAAEAPLPLDQVVMISLRNTDGTRGEIGCGAGIVVAQDRDRTLILTAKHVADGALQPEAAGRYLAVEFFGRKGEFVHAKGLEGPGLVDEELDYALLSVATADIPRLPDGSLALLPITDDAPRGVRIVGNGNCQRWSVIGVPRSVTSMSWNRMGFEGSVPPGTSGGPAFDDDGAVVGLVYETENEGAYAVPIQLILQNLRAHKVLLSLTRRSRAHVPSLGDAGGSGVDLAGANAILRDAVVSRPTSNMGQVEAVQALARAGKGIGGMDFDGIMLDALSAEALAAQDLSFVLGTLKKAELPNAIMTSADLTFADLSGGVFDGATMDTTEGSFLTATDASFKNVKLRKGNWSAAILDRSKFSGADLADSSFSLASLRDVDFTNASLGHGVFVGADLRGSKFDGARADSIDVTGALFDDATFPSALRGKLCSSEPPGTQTIELRIFEHRKATDSDYENIARWIGPLGFPEHLDRYFKTCPSRDGRLAEQSLVYSSIGKGDRDAINSALRADVTTEVVGAANRRATVKAKINELIARWSRQLEALGNSNSYYRGRRTTIIEAMDDSAKKMTRPAALMLSFDTDALIKAKYGLAKPEVRDLARNRLQLEQSDRIAYDSWPPLFPPETVWEDLDALTIQAFAKWNDWRLQNLPTRLKMKFSSPGQQTGDPAFFPKTVDEIMAPYDAEETPERTRRSDERAALCHELTDKLRFDSSKDAERKTLERKLNYNGINFFGCWQIVLPVDRSRVLEPSWFKKNTTLMLYEGWLIALNGGFPPIPGPANGTKLILSGTIERVLLLPPVAKVEQRTPVIVLRDLAVGSELPAQTAHVSTAK